jgi:arsenate reductase (thioredoxin)
MTAKPHKVLFLCTGNSARSIMAESILRKDGEGHFVAYSAGSQPKTEVNPLAIDTLERLGYPTEGLRAKSWDEFAVPGAPSMDFVFTVCDNAAGEACPIWPGQPMTAHWGIEDPACVEGADLAKHAAFCQALRHLKTRISLFLSLPIQNLDKLTLRSSIVEIGREAGASQKAQDQS